MEHLNWGLPVALDLFLAGLGAGAFLLAVMAQIAGDRKFRAVNIAGALIAPWPVILGVLLLVIDLGRPERFWEMLIRRGEGFLMFSPMSTMSIGTWLLTIFVIVSLAYLVVCLFTIPFRWGVTVRALVGLAGVPIALLVTIYTGVLIAATARPLWNAVLLPTVFVASALATGVASVVFFLALGRILHTTYEPDSPVPGLERVTGGIVGFQLLAVALFAISRIEVPAMKMIMGSGYGLLWWIGIVGLGLVVPLLLGLKGGSKRPQVSLVVATLVLLGGFFLRYVILFAGQMA